MLTLDPNDLGATLWIILLWSLVFLGIFFYSYRRRILSIFDPLVMLAVAQASYCVMGVALIRSPFLLFQFLASQAALVFGFLLVRKPRFKVGNTTWTNRDTQIAEWTVFFLFIVYLVANIWLGAATGFPLLSPDPSVSKVSAFTGGLGLIRRINMGVGVFVPAGALLLAVSGKHKRFFGVVFCLCILLASLGGSKGALIVFLQLICYVVYRKDLISSIALKRLRFVSIALAFAATALAVIVLFVVSKNWSLATVGILRRVLLQGDCIIYYYDPRVFPHFGSFGPVDYLSMVLNQLLGELRLAAYQFPLGYRMIMYYWDDPWISDYVFGPNTPFFIAGHIYFGSFFGVIYCGVVGFFVARMRNLFLETWRCSPLCLIWLLTLANLVFNLPTEVNLFTGPMLDMSVIVFLAVIATHVTLFLLGSPNEIQPLRQRVIAESTDQCPTKAVSVDSSFRD